MEERMKPLALWAQEQRMTYNKALNAVISGAVPAKRVGGRWFVDMVAFRAAAGKEKGQKRRAAAGV